MIDGNALGLSGAFPHRPADCNSLIDANALGRLPPQPASENNCNSLIDANALGPVALTVSSSLPASPVNPASVVYIDNEDDENIVLDIDNYPIVSDPVAP